MPAMLNSGTMSYDQMMRMQNGMQQMNGKNLERQAQFNNRNAFMGQP